MGKTALAWTWLHQDVLGMPLLGVQDPVEVRAEASQVQSTARPEGVLWWSFYEAGASFDHFTAALFRYLRLSDAQYTTPRDAMRGLVDTLASYRVLIVMDGFERELRAYANMNAPYQGDDVPSDGGGTFRHCTNPLATAFLEAVSSTTGRSHVLITSRLFPAALDDLAGCRREEMGGILPEDAVEFFRAYKILGTTQEIQSACEPYNYHPLALRLLAGLIVKDKRQPGDIRVAERLHLTNALKGRQRHHILEAAYNAMAASQRALLSMIAAFRSPMSSLVSGKVLY